jgi:F-type H+-transporting ATPase subunit delta
MSAQAVARRYAEALADVAVDHNLVDKIEGELKLFAEMISSSEDLQGLVASPIVSISDKAKVLEALIARLRPADFTANLLRILLRKDRLQHLGEVYDQYQNVINSRRGVVVATITTAEPVGPEQQQRLGAKLQQMTGKKIRFEFKSDSGLIGGVVTRVGSVVYDGSVRTQLQEIRQRLKTGE